MILPIRLMPLLVCLTSAGGWAAPEGRRDPPPEKPMADAMGQAVQLRGREQHDPRVDPRLKGRMSPEERRRLKADVSDSSRGAAPVGPRRANAFFPGD